MTNPTTQLEKPLYTLSVAAEMLGSHPQTLILYEQLGVVTRTASPRNRRRFTLADVLVLRAIARLRERYEMNVAGARQMIRCLQLLDAHSISRPSDLRTLNIEHVRV
jgi:MerR family transcriptional regulator/heat shock protein HspR